jgi:thiosulfate dehydrogenase
MASELRGHAVRSMEETMRNPVRVSRAFAFALLVTCSILTSSVLVGCAQDAPARDLADAADLARGGRLYDKWYEESGAPKPESAHPSYPTDAGYAAKPDAHWRCKECHGWDYLGRDGAYRQGSHRTGIPGITRLRGALPAAVEGVLRDERHGFGAVLSDDDLRALALFVSRGQVDMDAAIDRTSKVAQGDAVRGSAYYATICAGCHGADGRAEEMPVLGEVALENPWETLHKILNGQPNSAMPALRGLDEGVSRDVLRYLQTLPTGK